MHHPILPCTRIWVLVVDVKRCSGRSESRQAFRHGVVLSLGHDQNLTLHWDMVFALLVVKEVWLLVN